MKIQKNRKNKLSVLALLGACCVCSSICISSTKANANLVVRIISSLRNGITTGRLSRNARSRLFVEPMSHKTYKIQKQVENIEREQIKLEKLIMRHKLNYPGTSAESIIIAIEESFKGGKINNLSNDLVSSYGSQLIKTKVDFSGFKKNVEKYMSNYQLLTSKYLELHNSKVLDKTS